MMIKLLRKIRDSKPSSVPVIVVVPAIVSAIVTTIVVSLSSSASGLFMWPKIQKLSLPVGEMKQIEGVIYRT